MSQLKSGGKTIMSYVVIGVLLSLAVGMITYAFTELLRAYLTAVRLIHEIGMNVTGGNTTFTTIPLGNETVEVPRPANPGLAAVTDLLIRLLTAVGNILISPVGLSIILALTIISLALMEHVKQ